MSVKFVGSKFVKETIKIDGKSFTNCEFIDCKIVYEGAAKVVLNECTFNKCIWSFAGAAGNTLNFLSLMYSNLGDDGENLVENIFGSIKKGF